MPEPQAEQKIIWQPQPGPQELALRLIGNREVDDINIGGAMGGGKTDAIVGGWIKHWKLFGKYAYGGIFRRTLPELEHIKKRCRELLPVIGGVEKLQKGAWHMPDGAVLELNYLMRESDFAAYQGHEFTYLAFDELGNWAREELIVSLINRMRSAHGVHCQMMSSCNPGGIGHSWVKNRYIAPMNIELLHHIKERDIKIWRDPADKQVRVHIPARIWDNPILLKSDPNYINKIVASTKGRYWLIKAWLYGNWDIVPEGGIMKYEWLLGTYNYPLPSFLKVVMSVDTASKDKEITNSPTVFTIWGHTQNNDYLLHVEREWLKYPELKDTFRNLAAKWHPTHILVEDKSTGQSLIQELGQYGEGYPITPIEPRGDKVERFSRVSGWFQTGFVLLPETAAWKADYINELLAIPESAYMDQADSTSQYLQEVRGDCQRSLDSILKDFAAGGQRGAMGDGSRVKTIDQVIGISSSRTGRVDKSIMMDGKW